jgi:hypothetical protein
MAGRVEKAKGRVKEDVGALSSNESLKVRASLIRSRVRSSRAQRR